MINNPLVQELIFNSNIRKINQPAGIESPLSFLVTKEKTILKREQLVSKYPYLLQKS